MKRTGQYAFIIIVFILSFILIRKSMLIPKYSKTSDIRIQSIGYEEGFNIIESATKLGHGEKGYIKVQGQPGIEYIIKASYKKENKVFSASQRRIADENGQVTFIWTVSKETIPGTYPITIMGKGKTLNLDYTVLSKNDLKR